MNAKTLVRHKAVLCCGHELLFDVKPRVKEILYCQRCGNGKNVRSVYKVS